MTDPTFVRQPAPTTAAQSIRLAVSSGILAGAVVALVRGARRLLGGHLAFVGVDYYWLGPLLSGVSLALVTAIVVAPLRRIHLGSSLRVATLLPLSLAVLELLTGLGPTGLHPLAAIALTLGVATIVDRRIHRTGTRIPRLAWPLVIICVLGGVGIRGFAAVQRWRNDRGAGAASLPNVLLIVLDTVRGLSTSLYHPTPATTPFLDSLASTGVRVERMFSTAPWTGPSHASLFTGRWADQTGVDWTTAMPAKYPTLAEALTADGYLTAGFAGNKEYVSWDAGMARGFGTYRAYPISLSQLLDYCFLGRVVAQLSLDRQWLPGLELPARRHGSEVTADALAWLDRRPTHRPTFLFLNYYDAHAPYFAPEPYWSQFGGTGPARRLRLPTTGVWKPDWVLMRAKAYLAGIAALDAELRRLFGELARRGFLENTLVIVTADHGEEFQEHGVMGHGHSLYRRGLEVPFLMVWPGNIPADRRLMGPASIRDVPATVAGLVGLPGHPFPGRSLARLWSEGSAAQDTSYQFLDYTKNLPLRYPTSDGALAGVTLGGHRYFVDGKGRPFLYDLSDELEMDNLATQPAFDSLARRLDGALKAHR